MRFAGCWRRAARFWICWNWNGAVAKIRRWRMACSGLLNFMSDLCHVQTARASGEVGRICAELVFGYNRHPAWDDGRLQLVLSALTIWTRWKSIMPGIAACALDVIAADGSHAEKAGPCAGCAGSSSSSVCAAGWTSV